MIERARRVWVSVLVAALAFPPAARAQQTEVEGFAAGEVQGRIVNAAGKPLRAATILAYHLSTETVFESLPSDPKGRFLIGGLPYGYYDVAIRAADGFFISDRVVNVPPSGKVVVTVTAVPLDPSSAEASALDRPFPGVEGTPEGVARVARSVRGKEFWKSPKGLAIVGSLAGAALLVLALGTGEDEASPSAP